MSGHFVSGPIVVDDNTFAFWMIAYAVKEYNRYSFFEEYIKMVKIPGFIGK